jgi:hypothetical protein
MEEEDEKNKDAKQLITFQWMFQKYKWREIPNCPGVYSFCLVVYS